MRDRSAPPGGDRAGIQRGLFAEWTTCSYDAIRSGWSGVPSSPREVSPSVQHRREVLAFAPATVQGTGTREYGLTFLGARPVAAAIPAAPGMPGCARTSPTALSLPSRDLWRRERNATPPPCSELPSTSESRSSPAWAAAGSSTMALRAPGPDGSPLPTFEARLPGLGFRGARTLESGGPIAGLQAPEREALQ